MPIERLIQDSPVAVARLFSSEADSGIFFKIAGATLGVALHYLFDQPSEVDAATGAFILLVADTITGFAAAVKLKKPRTSLKLSRVISKLFGYLAVVAVATVVENTITKAANIPIVDGVLWLIIATEGFSILENVERMGLGRFKSLRLILGKVMDEGEDDNESKSVKE
jgi:toxin secretion/phage lysis holin